ncbi:hypothetical protein DFS34DRAFT_609494 [Phlyctochytrium arcticum]|nr:hypothetical protein DFS34DRAFT_609494 [Phlyctochytrium arcticum]
MFALRAGNQAGALVGPGIRTISHPRAIPLVVRQLTNSVKISAEQNDLGQKRATGSNVLNLLQSFSKQTPRLDASVNNYGSSDRRSKASSDLPNPDFINFSTYGLPKALHIIHVTANRNNTVCVFTLPDGRTLTWSSAGRVKLRKAARGTADAGYLAVSNLLELAEQLPAERKGNEPEKASHGLNLVQVKQQGVHLRLKGFGPGRDQALRAIVAAGWKVDRITDVTPIRHAGCRPRKKRRL